MQKEGSLPFNSQIEALRVLGRSIIKYLHCLVLTNRDINSRLRKTLYNLTADYLSGLGSRDIDIPRLQVPFGKKSYYQF
jgi:hypothetical protein